MDLMFIPCIYSGLINPLLRGPPGGWIPSGLGEDCLWNKLTDSGEIEGASGGCAGLGSSSNPAGSCVEAQLALSFGFRFGAGPC